MRIPVKIARDPLGQYRAACPALPGCVVYGLSRHDAARKIGEAICGYLAHLEVALPRELARRLGSA